MRKSDQKEVARVEATGEGSHSPTAMEERAGSRHSPLPWVVRRAATPSDGAYDHAICSPDTEIIAECFGRTSVTNWPDAEANAEFIVRACNSHADLLAALKEITAAIHDAGFALKACVPETAHLLRISDAVMRGLQVVRKAEGR